MNGKNLKEDEMGKVERRYTLQHSEHDDNEAKLSDMLLNRAIQNLPKELDLRKENNIKIKNQGQIGSCGAFALTLLREFLIEKNNMNLSPAFLYYEARRRRNEENLDFGITIKDGLEVLLNTGICEENLMPYDDRTYNQAPTDEAYINSHKYKVNTYVNLDQGVQGIINWLFIKKTPVVFGLEIPQQFNNLGKSGILHTPQQDDIYLGFHANAICGYKLNSWKDNLKAKFNNKYSKYGYFLVANSFSEEWGDDGFYWLPFEYILESRAFDFYVVTV